MTTAGYQGYTEAPAKDDHEVESALRMLLSPRYALETRIKHGSRGNVYRGVRKSDGKLVAIKVLRMDTASGWHDFENLEREARVLSSLHVPGTAQFHEMIQALDSPHPMSVLIQEYIDGRSLQAFLDKGARFHFTVTCQILIQILDIIKNLHHQNPPVIHRDIKPSNIILRFDEGKYAQIPQAFLIDFGSVSKPQAAGAALTGTYGYMAPEQFTGKAVPASDIYAFAMIAVYLMSGVPPEKMETENLHLIIEKHLEHLPYTVTVFLRQMLEQNPDQRLTDYQQIRSVLEMFAGQNFMIEFLDSAGRKNANYSLDHVKQLIQPGNITLWQNLPDKPPRIIPDVYRQMIHRDAERCLQAAQTLAFDKTKDLPAIHINVASRDFNTSHTEKFSPSMIMLMTYGIGLFLLGISFFAFIAYKDVVAQGNSPIWIFYIALYLCLMLFTIIGMIKHIRKLVLNLNHYKPLLEKIFKHGQKALATIESIQLLSNANAFDKSFGLDNIVSEEESCVAKTNAVFNKQIRPLWRVTYTFNPSDDNNPAPISHVYYSETYVDKSKIGDTLPILYYIDNNNVYSMPYPLPAGSSLLQCRDFVSNFNIKLRSTVYKF